MSEKAFVVVMEIIRWMLLYGGFATLIVSLLRLNAEMSGYDECDEWRRNHLLGGS